MVRRGVRRLAALLLCVGAAVLFATPVPGSASRRPLRVLQMNLCDSGWAGCYTGRAVPAAAGAVRAQRPDVVTLNEICQDDVDAIGAVLAGLYPGETVVRAFQAAGDRRTGAAFQCRNGRSFGIGLLARLPAPLRDYTVHGGLYPDDDQDRHDPEERAWLCVHAPGGFQACTTHLANTSRAVALAQCGYLLGVAVPAVRAAGGYVPTVVAGDLNLPQAAASCVPGYRRADDGAVQHVLASEEFTVAAGTAIDMALSTDHPALLVTLATG
ncbi:endonuclease/exonuclease/phosphatase family protein [Dactylosporangium sp. CA-092794]|uniref:endonuclease/exonuclease/phosphatase family protein n=1 Tax=Dactylosporangium sp. CA-092794 TaxID=3239929 RepID=UPI003D8A9840